MTGIEVEVADWELGCCGGPLAIGDRVSWRLLAVLDDTAPEDVWTATPAPDPGPGWSARVLAARGLQAGWSDLSAHLPVGTVRLRARLSATWHGGDGWDDLPPVTGRITRIRVISRLHQEGTTAATGQSSTWYAAHGGRTFVSVPGSEEHRDVDTAPDGVADRADTVPPRDQSSYRAESGWLVDLQLDP
ncbi:hypothetical protein SAMN05660199_03853 [Klenkia soli]|uniref:Uncharacterized protein n=1 Tax=Klenkia soli TaxID=1052260 RepID=A0A1H0SID7_9ACTN|nr:DUF6578 domain-containing protein [Klenkia soli]SDP41582.1 hypothetical protein SAMN05660199_03853 [Klenkia soli]